MQEQFTSARSHNLALFPLARRAGDIREAAATLLKKRSRASADRFRTMLAQEKFAELSVLGLSEDEQDEAVGAFLTEVEREMAELHYERIRMDV